MQRDDLHPLDRAKLRTLSAGEIAAQLGEKPRTIRDHCARLGIETPPAGTRRLPSICVPLAICETVEALAADHNDLPGGVLRDVVTHAFEEGAFYARRLLRRSERA